MPHDDLMHRLAQREGYQPREILTPLDQPWPEEVQADPEGDITPPFRFLRAVGGLLIALSFLATGWALWVMTP